MPTTRTKKEKVRTKTVKGWAVMPTGIYRATSIRSAFIDKIMAEAEADEYQSATVFPCTITYKLSSKSK